MSDKEAARARKNRLELIAAGLTSRRDLYKMGLLTGAGYLVSKGGLSSRASGQGLAPSVSPPTRSFIEALPILPVKEPVASLDPAPSIAPNTSAGEGRTLAHQAYSAFPPQKLYQLVQSQVQVSMSPDLPVQTVWGFDGSTPGPVFHARYGEPILVRNVNNLPADNLGFGNNSVSTHLHNGHTPSESDGFPCYFFGPGQFYDHHYPNALAGFSDPAYVDANGDIRESLSTLWYHDHRVDFTAQNVYKGLAGPYLLFNDFDTGDESTGFHLPSGQFDVPMMFGDKIFDPNTGMLFYDLFNLDGILGDRFVVNGKIQPFFEVAPRRYRLRWINTGPSRWHQLFLTDLNNVNSAIPFWHIANDGNLLPAPIQVTSVALAVAERADVIVDFSQFQPGQSIYLENRMQQIDGRGPTGNLLAAGWGNLILRFDVTLPAVADGSQDPATIGKFYDLPPIDAGSAAVNRTFQFQRGNGQWQINRQFSDCRATRFVVKQNSSEIWTIVNNSNGWMHPIHIHFEEHQIMTRNRGTPAAVERCRKDVTQLRHAETNTLFCRFRDFSGRYPLHCHNVVHEDHAMMVLWSIEPEGDTNPRP